MTIVLPTTKHSLSLGNPAYPGYQHMEGNSCADICTIRQAYRQKYRETDNQTIRQLDNYTNRQTDRQKNIQTKNRQKYNQTK